MLWDITFGVGYPQVDTEFFFEGRISGKVYLETPDTLILQRIGALFGDDHFLIQQDGAPPHHHTYVCAYLDNVAPGHWIGRRVPIEYPARSPNLTRLDFFLWDYLKNVVYNKKPHTLEELRYEIETASHAIPVDTLRG
ncbi:uncharacterized protein TNCV_3588861 [Trichonephila clavipes]|nr:uncharacterized protein TNCV_3588861 [Trichonephila clavipes]